MFEAVARSATDQQDVLQPRVEIDQKIAVGAVLVLADGADQGRATEQPETPVAIGDSFGEPRRVGRRPWVSGSTGPVHVMRELDSAAFEVGQAVEHVAVVEVGPAGHRSGKEAPIAAGGAKKKISCRVGKIRVPSRPGTLRQPGAEREHETVRFKLFARDSGSRIRRRCTPAASHAPFR